MTKCEYNGCDNTAITEKDGTDICYSCLDTITTCAMWKCDNRVKQGYAHCEEHPPLVDHGLTPNDTVCPDCGNVGFGTIHDDTWYCLDEYGYEGCGAIHDPYNLAGVEKKRKW